MAPFVIGFYGQSDSGKTTLITRLTKALSRQGYHVATVKQSEKRITLDSKGKDTWRHTHAGAQIVCFSTPYETTMFIRKKLPVHDLVRTLMVMRPIDCIFVEGASDPLIPKIRLGSRKKRPLTLMDYTGDFTSLLKFIQSRITTQSKTAVYVSVNGTSIPLTEFPSTVIHNTILGLLSSLKGVDTIHTVDIHLQSTP